MWLKILMVVKIVGLCPILKNEGLAVRVWKLSSTRCCYANLVSTLSHTLVLFFISNRLVNPYLYNYFITCINILLLLNFYSNFNVKNNHFKTDKRSINLTNRFHDHVYIRCTRRGVCLATAGRRRKVPSATGPPGSAVASTEWRAELATNASRASGTTLRRAANVSSIVHLIALFILFQLSNSHKTDEPTSHCSQSVSGPILHWPIRRIHACHTC
jgi:hypothetical protein